MPSDCPPTIAVIGAGPSGLMAAEAATASARGHTVHVYDAMPSAGRKLLMAGKGGLNITHAEPFDVFVSRYGERRAAIEPWLKVFGPDALRAWAHALGIDTFIGSSRRVFPAQMKAAPLLRAWIKSLRERGIAFHVRHRWLGWTADGALRFATPQGEIRVRPAATVFALGGGSWARLGSDGAWVPLLAARGVAMTPLRPANCGFDCTWSEHVRTRYAGTPLKSIVAYARALNGREFQQAGECIVTEHGIEGGAIYALSGHLRDTIEATGSTTLKLDLAPQRDRDRLARDLSAARGRRSLANHLREKAGISGVKAGLLREFASPADLVDGARLAALIKALPLTLTATRPIDEAISSAGGVSFDALDDALMLRTLPGVFCAGEMLDWEAPTGGYLLTACLASGRLAGAAAARWATTTARAVAAHSL